MNTNGTRRVLIQGNGQGDKAIAMAIKLGIEFSKKVTDEVEGVVLYLPDKKSIRNSSLEKVISPKIAELLQKGQQVPMAKGLGLRAETVGTYKNGSHREILIVIGAESKMMAKVDGMAGLHTVIAVPKEEGALDCWAKTWAPIIPGAKKKMKKRVKIDPVVEDALAALAVSIDLSVHGLAEQDQKQVVNMIRLLKQNNRLEKSANIRKWAANKGWHLQTVDELVNIWEEVYELKDRLKVKGGFPLTRPGKECLSRVPIRSKENSTKGSNRPLVLSKDLVIPGMQ